MASQPKNKAKAKFLGSEKDWVAVLEPRSALLQEILAHESR